jgi:membrane protein implicated in regulation of membrane protease activity
VPRKSLKREVYGLSVADNLQTAAFAPKCSASNTLEGQAMDAAAFWWIAAAVLVITEMLAGTVYLLAIALGLAAGALAAHAGLSFTVQIIVAALIGTASTLFWHFSSARKNRMASSNVAANTDVHQDIGALVMVDAWNADGTAQVKYRGAQWSVILASGAAQHSGAHRVKEVMGSRFVVEPV